MTDRPNPASDDRMPLPPKSERTQEQSEAIARIAAGPRGEVMGPFIPLLRSPELMHRVQYLGEFLRFDCDLPDHLFEFVVLTVARAWDQDFEWGVHFPLAVKSGISDEVINGIQQGKRPPAEHDDLIVVWEVAGRLIDGLPVDDGLYERVVDLLGERGAIELTTTIGYYVMLAMVLNFAQTPGPAGMPTIQIPEQGARR